MWRLSCPPAFSEVGLSPLRPSAQVGPSSGCASALCHASIQPCFEHSVKKGERRSTYVVKTLVLLWMSNLRVIHVVGLQ